MKRCTSHSLRATSLIVSSNKSQGVRELERDVTRSRGRGHRAIGRGVRTYELTSPVERDVQRDEDGDGRVDILEQVSRDEARAERGHVRDHVVAQVELHRLYRRVALPEAKEHCAQVNCSLPHY